MGTVLDLSLRVRPGEEARARRALERAFAQATSLGALATRFDPASAISRLNAAAGSEAIELDPRLYALLERAESARGQTRGAFDVSVGPLVGLWTRAAVRGRPPTREELAAARSLLGRIELQDGRAALATPGMSVDLGGIAKGFALDRIRARLEGEGFGRCLLSFGQSSVWGGGQIWRLALQSDDGSFAGVVALRDQALSMSSSLSQSSVIDGVRYGHVVDPRSGQALQARRTAVVVAPRATDAEVLSTALLVLDEVAGRAVVAEQGAEAWVRGEDGTVWETAGWRERTRFRALAPAPSAAPMH